MFEFSNSDDVLDRLLNATLSKTKRQDSNNFSYYMSNNFLSPFAIKEIQAKEKIFCDKSAFSEDSASFSSSGYCSSSSADSFASDPTDHFELFPSEPHIFALHLCSLYQENLDTPKHHTLKPNKNPIQESLPTSAVPNEKDGRFITFVVETVATILRKAPDHTLKAVELANTLKRKAGRKQLVWIKERFGGLLVLLERYPKIFKVNRIPKKDTVQLQPEYIHVDSCKMGTRQQSSVQELNDRRATVNIAQNVLGVDALDKPIMLDSSSAASS